MDWNTAFSNAATWGTTAATIPGAGLIGAGIGVGAGLLSGLFADNPAADFKAPSQTALDALIQRGASGSDIAKAFGLSGKYGGYFSTEGLSQLQAATDPGYWSAYRQAMFQQQTTPAMMQAQSLLGSVGSANSGIFNKYHDLARTNLASAGYRAEQSFLDRLSGAKNAYNQAIQGLYNSALQVQQSIMR